MSNENYEIETWHRNIKPASKYAIIFTGKAPNHKHVAQVLSSGLTDDEVESNCNLIAAAPELLDALQNLVWRYEEYADSGDEECEFMEAARKALNKADGVY